MMDIQGLKQRKQEIDNKLKPLYANPAWQILKRRLQKGNLMDKVTVQRQFNELNKPILKLKDEKEKVLMRMAYMTDDDDIIKKRKIPPSLLMKEGASIGLPQMEQMNLFGVGGIFR